MGTTRGGFLTLFGDELRHHRERAGMTQGDVGQKCGYGNGLVSKIERAERVPQPELCDALDELFGTPGSFARLGAQAREHSTLAPEFRAYVVSEPDATAIHTYATHLIPGLLQTPEYARAVIEAERPTLTPDVVEARLAARLTRQDVLTRNDPPRLWVVVGEAVLYTLVGSRAVLAGQLRQVRDKAAWPHITLQVLPYEAGVTPAMGLPFIVAEFASRPDVFHVDAPPGVSTDAHGDTAARFRVVFDHLRASALSEAASLDRLTGRIEELS